MNRDQRIDELLATLPWTLGSSEKSEVRKIITKLLEENDADWETATAERISEIEREWRKTAASRSRAAAARASNTAASMAVVALALVALVVVASIWMQRFFSTRALFRLCARLLLFP